MLLDRSEFFAVVGINSKYIYVFGGTLKPEERNLIERYDSWDDNWDMLEIKVNSHLDIFNTFCILLSPPKDKSPKK